MGEGRSEPRAASAAKRRRGADRAAGREDGGAGRVEGGPPEVEVAATLATEKAAAETQAASTSAHEGVLGPVFSVPFPRDPELDALVAAFTRGDYRRVRERAPQLAAQATSEEVRQAALELVARTSPDPVGRSLILLALGLLLFLAYRYLGHGHGAA